MTGIKFNIIKTFVKCVDEERSYTVIQLVVDANGKFAKNEVEVYLDEYTGWVEGEDECLIYYKDYWAAEKYFDSVAKDLYQSSSHWPDDAVEAMRKMQYEEYVQADIKSFNQRTEAR